MAEGTPQIYSLKSGKRRRFWRSHLRKRIYASVSESIPPFLTIFILDVPYKDRGIKETTR